MEEKLHILLVDDEPDFMEPLAFWLRAKGYYVLIADVGEKAIQMIKEERPNIVFLDVVMPFMDGIETLRRIREFNQELPVIMLTAFPETKEFIRDLKISGFLAKDEDFEKLQDTIESTLKTYNNSMVSPGALPNSP